ncbi:hypothetical protein [Streptomyces sp. NPDC059515]|uniref:hypothetical protein n=1 Tax=Streptomyces sp. NPDC059515 TaxID=3346854 RepID=UPI0036BE52A7
MSKQRAALGFLAVALSAGVAFGAAAPAQAASVSKKCTNGPANCVLGKTNPKKQTIRVTVDNSGNKATRYAWDIRHKGKIICTGEVRENWKKKTFTCKNMPKGNLWLTMPYRLSTQISMAW